jgi:predicted nuclease of predicted toxin-antitoxin system
VRFKLDENLPVELTEDLRRLGHDADTVADEGLCGASDPTVVDSAYAADRILFTLDKGIANLRRYPVQQHAGVVLFRPDASGRSAVIAFVRNRLPELIEMDLAGRLTVVGPSRIRNARQPGHRCSFPHIPMKTHRHNLLSPPLANSIMLPSLPGMASMATMRVERRQIDKN